MISQIKRISMIFNVSNELHILHGNIYSFTYRELMFCAFSRVVLYQKLSPNNHQYVSCTVRKAVQSGV